MNRFINVLLLLLLLCLNAGAERLKAEVVNSGTYLVTSAADTGSRDSSLMKTAFGDSLKLVQRGNTIKAKLGMAFGFHFRLNSSAKRVRHLGSIWEHPEYTDPKTGKSFRRQKFRESVLAGYSESAVIFMFEYPWEIAEGTWTVTLTDEEGYPLIRERFEVKLDQP